jgi:translational regulator
MEDIFKGYGVEVRLAHAEDFLKIKETLTRIGVASKRELKIYQSCHILHKQGRYVIIHFKELFSLDGKETTFSEEDRGRRNTIAQLLEDWGLVTIVDPSAVKEPRATMAQIKVLPFAEKHKWQLEAKYSIGKKRG